MQAVCWKQNVCFQRQANTHIFASVHVALLLSRQGCSALFPQGSHCWNLFQIKRQTDEDFCPSWLPYQL